jgi:hypothetical protein
MSIVVQIDENNPGGTLSSAIVSLNLQSDILLAVLSVDVSRNRARVCDEPANDGLIYNSLYGSRDNHGFRHLIYPRRA